MKLVEQTVSMVLGLEFDEALEQRNADGYRLSAFERDGHYYRCVWERMQPHPAAATEQAPKRKS